MVFFVQLIAAECWQGRGGKLTRILGKNTIINEHPVHIQNYILKILKQLPDLWMLIGLVAVEQDAAPPSAAGGEAAGSSGELAGEVEAAVVCGG